MPTCLNNLPERVMINEFISEHTGYDWQINMETGYDEIANEDIYETLHYTNDLEDFRVDVVKINRKTRKAQYFHYPISDVYGKFLLHYNSEYTMEKEDERSLHTAAILRRVNGNTI